VGVKLWHLPPHPSLHQGGRGLYYPCQPAREEELRERGARVILRALAKTSIPTLASEEL
jgi:hypothetical protein